MKVLYLQHGLGYGGATKSLMLMQKAVSDTVECHTVLSRTKKINKKIKNGFINSKEFNAFDIPSIYSHSQETISLSDFNRNRYFYPDKLIQYINHNNIDIIHINSSLFANILRPIKEKTKCKIITHVREMLPHGRQNIIDDFIITNYLQFSDAIIAISNNEVRHFGVSHKIHVIPNPHDFSETDRFCNFSNVNSGRVLIGMCANFQPIKGHLIFLDAAKIINDTIRHSKDYIQFMIIGYPMSILSWKKYVKRIFHLGYQYQFDRRLETLKLDNLRIIPFTFNIYQELAEFDIYVRPDLSGNPWGRDVIEAMALKKPIIATGLSDYFVEDGVTGFLVPPNNADIMAKRIWELIQDPHRRLQMGESGYRKARRLCDISDYGKRIYEIYKSVLI
jgi:glycosyltransferase involved in cell wall biosynthesis